MVIFGHLITEIIIVDQGLFSVLYVLFGLNHRQLVSRVFYEKYIQHNTSACWGLIHIIRKYIDLRTFTTGHTLLQKLIYFIVFFSDKKSSRYVYDIKKNHAHVRELFLLDFYEENVSRRFTVLWVA